MRQIEGLALLVENDRQFAELIAGWLERVGLTVMTCSGPSAPEYTCVGASRGGCPLARGADLILLDPWLASDAALLGTSSTDLLSYYVGTEKPVIGFIRNEEDARLFVEEDIVWVDWPPDRAELVESVRSILRERRRQKPQASEGA